MNITSLSFLLFFAGVFIVYWLVPKKIQWVVLLAASIGFYLSFGIKSIIFVLITATTVFLATRGMETLRAKKKQYLKDNKETLSKEQKNAYKNKIKKQIKAIMIITLLVNLGLLCTFKYLHFAVDSINSIIPVFGGNLINNEFSLIVPLGISFYTFQSLGYLLDVYWEYYEAEKNYFKVLLFVCFFPQMTQGPISDFEKLSSELFKEHELDYKSFSWGGQRFLWGLMKKMVLADILAPFVDNLFENYVEYTGIAALIGAFMYSIQIYADFSGYMDIMCGLCEMLGIKLSENFNTPYFSKSIAEYWRRWHITLGEWFKKYIYYPIGMSDWSRKFAKNTQKKFGKHFANTMPATIALIVTWLTTGLWHGANWAYVAWGLVNGLFIILSLWMEPVYKKVKLGLHINEEASWWKLFQIVRTFLLVTLIKVLPEVGTLSQGFGLIKQIFSEHTIPSSFQQIIPFGVDASSLLSILQFLAVIFATVLLFAADIIQQKAPVRSYFNKLPKGIRILCMAGLFVFICMFGISASIDRGGFMYAKF